MLIFDEVITFRVSTGGVQKLTGVIPDLTALGKTIGGGLPIGAFGGRREIIEQFNPTNKEFIQHSGTFSGNAMSMVAGIAAMKNYDEEAVNRLGGLGDMLRTGLKQVFDELGIKGSVHGVQSLCYTYFFKESIYNNRKLSYKTIPYLELAKYLQMTLIMNGLYALSRGITPFLLSTAMIDEDINEILVRFKKALEMVLPIYKDVTRFDGFAAIIYSMLKNLNNNENFKRDTKEENYSLLLASKDNPYAIKLKIENGQIDFIQLENKAELIKREKKACDGSLITSYLGVFLGLGLGKVNAIPAVLSGKLKLSGIKNVLKFTNYFDYLKE
jgi:putative sterol carrier protein